MIIKCKWCKETGSHKSLSGTSTPYRRTHSLVQQFVFSKTYCEQCEHCKETKYCAQCKKETVKLDSARIHGKCPYSQDKNDYLWLCRSCHMRYDNPMRENNTSGFIGVSGYKNNRWRAYISVNGKQINLGHYANKVDAVNARKAAEIKYGFNG